MNFLSTPLVPILAVTFSDLLWSFLNFSALLHPSVLFCALLLPISTLLLFVFCLSSLPFFFHPSLLISSLCSSLLLSPCSPLFHLFSFFAFFDLSCPSLSLFHSFWSLGFCLPISTHRYQPFSALLCHSSPPSTPLSFSPMLQNRNYRPDTQLLFPSLLPSSVLFTAFLYPSPHLSSPFHLLWHQDIWSYHCLIYLVLVFKMNKLIFLFMLEATS